MFNEGYWGPTVGFYGGINYGYGYFGSGYWGGRWEGHAFTYNTAVTRVNAAAVHNAYVNRSVMSRQVNASHASFNGPNGVKAEPTATEKAAAENAQKVPPTSEQLARREAASKERNLQASVNHGQPKADAIRSFNKSVAHGTAAQAVETAAAKARTKPASISGRKGTGNIAQYGNRRGTKNYAKSRNVKGSEAKTRFGKAARHQSLTLGHHGMVQRSARPGMGRPGPQAGGNRAGHTPTHQQGKSKR